MLNPRLFLSFFLAIALTACGGGGGGGGGSGNPPPTTATPPTAPVVNYSGNTQPAALDKTNAPDYAAAAVTARTIMVLVESLWIDTAGASGEVSETISGSGGGTATLRGNISGSTGWLDVRFTNFSDAGISVNGRYIQRITSSGRFPNSLAGLGSLEFDDLSITAAGQALELRGVLALSSGIVDEASLDLLVTEASTGSQIYYGDFTIGYTLVDFRGGSLWGQELSGTIYESTLGAVSVTSLEPFPELEVYENPGFVYSHRGGRVRLEGAGNAFEFSSLSRTWTALEMDVDGDGTMDEARRISWGALSGIPEMAASVRSGPIANAGNELLSDVGGTATVHALYSHDDDGDWLTFDWQILARPIGSAIMLSDPGTATQAFVPDLAGEYLLGVTVSDGVEATKTTVKVQALPPRATLQREARTLTGGLEVSPPFLAGSPIVIDGRSAMNRPYVPGFGSWWVDGPGNWTLTELQSPQEQEFLTDSDGIYVPRFNESTTGGPNLNTSNSVKFVVGTQLPTTEVEYHADTNARTVILADYDDDGLDDLVVGVASFMNTGARVVRNLGGGDWEMGPQADGPYGEIAVGDLDGDSRMDIALAGDDGVYISYQQVDGTPADTVVVPYPGMCNTSTAAQDIGIGDIDGDGRDDLFAVVVCNNELAVWRQDDTGGLDAPTLELPGELVRYGEFVDVNGDGRTDALLGLWGVSPGPAQSVIALAQPDGTLAVDERFDAPGSSSTPAISIADINGDSLDDVVLVDSIYLHVHERQQDGSTVQTVQQSLAPFIGSSATIKVLDIDEDGDSDILLCNQSRELWVLNQGSSNSFGEIELGECVNELSGRASVFAVGDFNGDGLDDIVLGSEGPINLSTEESFLRVLIGGATNYATPVN